MKLSEAVVLGLGFVEFEPALYLSERRKCGCLLGAGFVAVRGFNRRSGFDFVSEIAEIWPWLSNEYPIPEVIGLTGTRDGEQMITYFAHCIKSGRVSLEQALDWIRSVEPAETPVVESEDSERQIVEEKILA